jgi:Mycothiol maleylpyruvate isomerase N-terminal domain
MKPADHIVAVRRDGNRIAIAAEGRLDRIVPSCPGWQVADLVWHVGIVHMFWQMVARGALSGPEAWSEPDRPTNDGLLAWFRGGVDLTATILDSLDPDTPAWT